MNPGLLTCEASALPLSYIPDDVSQFVFPTCLIKQARQTNKQTNKQKNNLEITTIAQKQQILHNTHAQKKWRYRDLNAGLLTCEASALPLSYIPDDVSQFVFPTCLVKQARQKKKKNKQKKKTKPQNLEITTIAQKQQILHNTHAQKKVEIPGFEPGASHMRSERSTTELYPR